MAWANTYTNAIGDSVTFRFRSNDVHSYDFNSNDSGLFSPKDKTITFEAVATSVEERARIQDTLSHDSLTGDYGILDFDGWQIQCRTKKITWGNWELRHYVAKADIEMESPTGYWHRTTTVHVGSNVSAGTVTTGLDFPTDLPFDLAGTSTTSVSRSVGNRGGRFLVGARFYGACSDPYVVVTSDVDGKKTSNRYGVKASASAGEQIVIDPLNKDVAGEGVYLRTVYGKDNQNLFSKRVRGTKDSGSYIFQVLPCGYVSVAIPQDVVADISFIEESVIPPWS